MTEVTQQAQQQASQVSKFDTSYTGTTINRIDAKGRLSIPPEYRKLLQPTIEGAFFGVYCLPSLVDEGAIECGGVDFIDFLLQLVSNVDEFESARADIEETIYAEMLKLSFDKEGRITLPEALRAQVGLKQEAAIVGRANRFLLMDPSRVDSTARRARTFLKDHKETYRARSVPSVSARKGSVE
ncbi:MAG: hypothetical protein V3V30_08505 [Parvularculaceae bacterium]